jgi:sugar/nucleoside kinase (ribokinase family)
MKQVSSNMILDEFENHQQNNGWYHPRFTSVGGIQIDIKGTPEFAACGAKWPTRFYWDVGGSPCHSAKVAASFDIPSAVIAPQAAAMAGWCRERLKTSGVYPILVERLEESPATTVALPNGKPGAYELFIQRARPLKASELAGEPTKALWDAEVVAVGPIAEVSGGTLELYRYVTGKARFRALFPHPNLVKHECFADVAREFDYVQMNVIEAQPLDPRADDIAKLALRLRRLLNEKVEFAITNGSEDGLLWAQDNGKFGWHKIQPTTVKIVGDIGAGDIWGTAYLISRRFFGKCASVACAWATQTAARAISGQPLMPTEAGALPDEFVNRSWAEIAL